MSLRQTATINILTSIATLVAGVLGIYALYIISLGISAGRNNELGAGGALIQGGVLVLGAGLFLLGLHRAKMPLAWLAVFSLLLVSLLFVFGTGLPPLVATLLLLVLLVLMAFTKGRGGASVRQRDASKGIMPAVLFLIGMVLFWVLFVLTIKYLGPESYFYPNPAIDTVFAATFSEEKFSQIAAGMTAEEVVQLLGQPLDIVIGLHHPGYPAAPNTVKTWQYTSNPRN